MSVVPRTFDRASDASAEHCATELLRPYYAIHPTGRIDDRLAKASKPGNLAALYAIFDDRQHPYYEHREAA